MGPNTKRALLKRWEVDTNFQKFCAEELRSQRNVQLHILSEIRKLSGLIEKSLGDNDNAMEAIRTDVAALQERTQEHERKLAGR